MTSKNLTEMKIEPAQPVQGTEFDRLNQNIEPSPSSEVVSEVKPGVKRDEQELLARVQYYREQINAGWHKSFDAIIDVGMLCFNANQELSQKGDMKDRLISSLKFNKSVFSMLCAIGRRSKGLVALKGYIPASYSTLYLIANANGEHVYELIQEGRLTTSSTRDQVRNELKLMNKIEQGRNYIVKEREAARSQEKSEGSKAYKAGWVFADIRYPEKNMSHENEGRFALELEKLCKKFRMVLDYKMNDYSGVKEALALLQKKEERKSQGKETVLQDVHESILAPLMEAPSEEPVES